MRNDSRFLSRARSWLPILFVVLLCVIPFWLASRLQGGYAYDDAYITLTYARNVAEGKGFVYNGGEPYLGTTTPGLTLTLAGLKQLLPVVEIPLLAVWFGAAMWSLSILLSYLVGRRIGGELAGVVPAIFALTTSIYLYVLSAEFPMLIMLSLLAMWLAMQNKQWGAGVVLGVAFLTRGDAALFAALLGLVLIQRNRRLPWGLGFGFLVIVVPWLIYGYAVFGNPLPASLSVKSAHRAVGAWPHITTGFWNWISATTLFFRMRLLLTTGASLISLGFFLWKRNLWAAVLVIWGMMYAAAYVWLNVPFYLWYSTILFVSMTLAAGVAVALLFQYRPDYANKRLAQAVGVAAKVVAVAVFGAVAGMGISNLRERDATLRRPVAAKTAAYIEAGNWLAENTPEDSTVGFVEVGWIGYYSHRQIIDLLGLVTPGTEAFLEARDHPGLLEHLHPDYYVRNKNFDGWGMNSTVHESYFFNTRYIPVAEIPQRGLPPLVIYQRLDGEAVAANEAGALPLIRVVQLSGAHLSLAAEPPPGFEGADEGRVQVIFGGEEDVLLHVVADETPLSAQLRQWLKTNNALHLTTDQGDVYWLTSAQTDSFAEIRQYELVEALSPGDQLMLWRQYALDLRRENNFSDAERAYRSALALLPNDTASLMGLAASLLGLGRAAEAIPYLEQAVLLIPNDFWAHRLLGNAYTHQQRFAEAAVELAGAAEIDDADPRVLLDLARAQSQAGESDLARQTLDTLAARTDAGDLAEEITTLRESLP